MDILKSNISLVNEYIKTVIDNKELLKNSQNNKEEKLSQKGSQEKKKTKQIKRRQEDKIIIKNTLRNFAIDYQDIR